ncbi:fumarylacetoacetate hydrolase family protein [Reyranella sp. CPCC 100927]|uniref:fumarylacetoacetate hydrolase family protein n=1 Tax=Reyranella sp. CPCC 100927 TaxID=2599616 RepID=UPI0011B6C92F|nr:fumarylacetoacetate hydrolase family protein [Reyranella sp. CPCC 100927]TWT14102.1 fumarylacetoacetate hydrolase family protein [Reyranella sp. CPCC 100927]
MKLVRYWHDNAARTGLVRDDQVVDVATLAPALESLGAALTVDGRGVLANTLGASVAAVPLAAVTLLPPLAAGARLFCIGLNYKTHVEETGRDLPAQPSVFIRTAESVVGANASMIRPAVSEHFDFEGELAVVIGTPGHRITEAASLTHVGGYTCFNDGSLRDFQKFSVTAGKNFDASGAIGPWIVTADEIPDPTRLVLTTRLNGTEVQKSGTDMLIYPLPRLISYISQFAALRVGDVIATGTPAGVGARRTPPLWMRPGDVIEVDISGIGVLRNPIAAA